MEFFILILFICLFLFIVIYDLRFKSTLGEIFFMFSLILLDIIVFILIFFVFSLADAYALVERPSLVFKILWCVFFIYLYKIVLEPIIRYIRGFFTFYNFFNHFFIFLFFLWLVCSIYYFYFNLIFSCSETFYLFFTSLDRLPLLFNFIYASLVDKKFVLLLYPAFYYFWGVFFFFRWRFGPRRSTFFYLKTYILFLESVRNFINKWRWN